MRKVLIKYNPYKVETNIIIDGKPIKQNSSLNVEDVRLQEWVEELPQRLVDECNTKRYDITFHGTLLDYEDLVSVIQENKIYGFEAECQHLPAKEVQDKEQAITEVFSEIQEGPFDELKQPDVLKAFKIAQNSEFPVNVVATMSAGKSTMINALLQQKLMPAKQEACTATITEIKDADNDYFHAEVYNKNGDLIEVCSELSLLAMEQFNSNPEVSMIRAEGNIPFVSSDDVSLVLVDTPGPNNSRDPEHKAATYRMLSESSKTLVLYLLNATQLAVNDDNNLLNYVADSMKVGGKQSKDRFIFVVNKLDEFKPGEDSVSGSIDKVRNYLEDKGIKNPNIYPASALTALEIRTALKNEKVVGYSEDELDELDDRVAEAISKVKKINRNSELHLEQYAPLTPSIKTKISNDINKALELASKDNSDPNIRSEGMKQLALIHSGIVPIESAIHMYVLKYAKTAKIKNIVDTFLKKLESQQSFENTRREIASNQDKQQGILMQIDSIKTKLKNGEEAQEFKRRIDAVNFDKEIKKLANNKIKDVQIKIENKINKSNVKLSTMEAESIFQEFSDFIEDMQAELQTGLEEIITNHVELNVKSLINQYKQRVVGLSSKLDLEGINIDPFKILDGDMVVISDMNSILEELTQTDKVEMDKEWISNSRKKWFKPWTWFQKSGWYKDVYGDKEYIEGTELAKRFFAPTQQHLYDTADLAVDYAKMQTQTIKREFKKKFDILDDILQERLMELEVCATDKENVESIIEETQFRLDWLESIQNKMQEILDI